MGADDVDQTRIVESIDTFYSLTLGLDNFCHSLSVFSPFGEEGRIYLMPLLDRFKTDKVVISNGSTFFFSGYFYSCFFYSPSTNAGVVPSSCGRADRSTESFGGCAIVTLTQFTTAK